MSESFLKVDNREGDSKRNWLYAKGIVAGLKLMCLFAQLIVAVLFCFQL